MNVYVSMGVTPPLSMPVRRAQAREQAANA